MELEYILTNAEKEFWEIVGYFCAVFTFGLAFRYFYSFFWERKAWYTRKRLLWFLKETTLPKSESVEKSRVWETFGYTITLSGEVVYVFKGDNLILSSYHENFGPDKKRYDEILNILRKEINP